jgi:hypothetical protein
MLAVAPSKDSLEGSSYWRNWPGMMGEDQDQGVWIRGCEEDGDGRTSLDKTDFFTCRADVLTFRS